MEERSVTRRQVKARIVAAGCPEPSDEQIDRWGAAGLVCEPPSQGRPSAYGYTEAQAQRSVLIARIASNLPSKRVRTSEIAFWLAFNGATDVPVDLVCQHIEASIQAIQSRIWRILNELGRGNEADYVGVIGTAQKLGGLLARSILLKLVPVLGDSALAQEFLGAVLGVFLPALKQPTPYEVVSSDLGKASAVLSPTSEPLPAKARRELFSIFTEAFQFLRWDDKNEMLLGIRAIAASDDSRRVLQVVESARNLLITASKVFPWMLNPGTLPFLGLEDRLFFARYFAPTVCGLNAALRDNEYAQQFDADLRAGKTERALSELSQMKQLGEYVANKLSAGDRT